MSRSLDSGEKKSRSRAARRKSACFILYLLLKSSQDARDGFRKTPPSVEFRLRHEAALARQLVEFCLAVVFRNAPLGPDQPVLFEPVKRGIKRPLLDAKYLVGKIVYSLRNGVAVV